jgi:hypothetical protein
MCDVTVNLSLSLSLSLFLSLSVHPSLVSVSASCHYGEEEWPKNATVYNISVTEESQ